MSEMALAARTCAGHEHVGQRNGVTDRFHHPTATAAKRRHFLTTQEVSDE